MILKEHRILWCEGDHIPEMCRESPSNEDVRCVMEDVQEYASAIQQICSNRHESRLDISTISWYFCAILWCTASQTRPGDFTKKGSTANAWDLVVLRKAHQQYGPRMPGLEKNARLAHQRLREVMSKWMPYHGEKGDLSSFITKLESLNEALTRHNSPEPITKVRSGDRSVRLFSGSSKATSLLPLQFL